MNKQLLIGFFSLATLIGFSLAFAGCGEPPEEPYACNGTVLSVYGEPDVDCADNTNGNTRCSCDGEVGDYSLALCACVPELVE